MQNILVQVPDKSGELIDSYDMFQRTILHRCVQDGYLEVVNMLLNCNASRHLRNGRGQTAYDIGNYNDKSEIANAIINFHPSNK